MKYHFSAVIKVNITLTRQDFNILFTACSHHYDATVRSITLIGGFLSGLRNQFEYIYHGEKEKELDTTLSFRDISLLCKALETERDPRATVIYFGFLEILSRMKVKSDYVNNH